MLKGSCLCGAVTYEIDASIEQITHCHCTMCQKAHGAAFATYTTLPKARFRFTSGTDDVTTYRSSAEVIRSFCRRCGSNLQFLREGRETFGLALGTLDSSLKAVRANNIHMESKPVWYDCGKQ